MLLKSIAGRFFGLQTRTLFSFAGRKFANSSSQSPVLKSVQESSSNQEWESKKLDKVQETQLLRQQLKTYLEVISPKEVFEIVQSKQKNVKTLISILKNTHEAIDPVYDKQITNHLTKNVKYLTPQQTKDIIKIACEHPQNKALSKLYKRLLNIIEMKAEEYELTDLINIAYTLAKSNKNQPQVFTALEKRVVEEKIPLDASVIRKILFAFTHLNAGTATLYSQVCRTIKIGQHELEPLNLAEFAYHLSKVQENAKGGYGVFQIAQQHLKDCIKVFQFNQLTKVASYLLVQNIGSNEFQQQLESQLCKKFPKNIDSMQVAPLIRLIKAVSGYMFKFKDQSLMQILDNASIKNVAYCSLEHMQEMVWSWGRARRGTPQLWEKLQNHYLQKYNLLKSRDLAFAIHSFCRNPHRLKTNLIPQMIQRFASLNPEEVKLHNYIKVLTGLQNCLTQNYSESFLKLCHELISRMEKLTRDDFVNFLVVLGDSDLHYESEGVEKFRSLFKVHEKRLLEVVDYIGVGEASNLLFLWIKLGQHLETGPANKFIEALVEILDDDLMAIPKKPFLKTLFSLTMIDRYDLVLSMLPILYELRKYGPLGYFFPPNEYPLLAYCIYHIKVNGKSQNGRRLPVPNWILGETKEYLGQLEPRTLNEFESKVYEASLSLIKQYESTVAAETGGNRQ